jgi:hypothetical protein
MPQIVSQRSLIIVILSVVLPITVFMFDEGVFWGLISIAGVIAGLGTTFYLTYRKRGNEFTDMLDFLRRITLSHIDEKIAMLEKYISEVPNWKNESPNYVNSIIERIASDLTSLSRIRKDITDDQMIKIRERIIRLSALMKKDNHDTAKIEAILGLFK